MLPENIQIRYPENALIRYSRLLKPGYPNQVPVMIFYRKKIDLKKNIEGAPILNVI